MILLSPVRAVFKNTRVYKRRQNFIDSLRVHVQGGSGGMGYPKYGGVGGRGGNVYVEGKEVTVSSLAPVQELAQGIERPTDMTLKDLKKSFKSNQQVKASVGQDSSVRSILGRPGDDVVIQCPPGITVMNELGQCVGEIMKEGDSLLVASGGVGGCMANGFSGTRGQALTIRLDLKLIADVAFVGFPNAGKSTLLSQLSRASPKIASYPFTTLRPTIGLVSYQDERQISLADLPGLIEGAHVNRGLGHQFLRHIERSKVLLIVVDVQGFQLSHKYKPRTCIETILLLNKEVELYKKHVLSKPAMLLINKMDIAGAEERSEEVIHAVRDLPSVLHKYPEDMHPEQPFEFVSVQKLSAKTASDVELTEYKKEIRRVLDWVEADTETEAQKEADLMKELQQNQREYGPSLV